MKVSRLLLAEQSFDILGGLVKADFDPGETEAATVITNALTSLDVPTLIAHRLHDIAQAPEELREELLSMLLRDMSSDLMWKARRLQALQKLDLQKWMEQIVNAIPQHKQGSVDCTCKFCQPSSSA